MADLTLDFTFVNGAGSLTDETISVLKSHITEFEDGVFTVTSTERIDDHRTAFHVETAPSFDLGYGVATLLTDRVFRSFRDEYCRFGSDAPTDEQHTIDSLSFEYTEDIENLDD